MSRLFFGLGLTSRLIASVGFLIFHLWTVLLAYSQHGILGGLIALCLPVVAEVYWFFYSIGIASLFNTYSLLLLVNILFAVGAYLFILLATYFEDKKEQKQASL
ncbi:hypothetical protein CEF21_15085 [Bacillus sp. FJAT-42376]|uniref:hypothetical protein n=1 Tax=Bacillus sp. FJAT-42376 TaxID=2014076 RepID=UPI000F5048B3|nr:hypothetical protein [Bacillus sp. FJAT-42376]AZB43520.1 hypothetical protein CEF21_15085 [Bacillus sp. FJAT-42376]